jgi:hypothetical protein
MAAVTQRPEDKAITLVQGDDLVFDVRVELDLTGYTVTSGIYNSQLVAPEVEFEPTLVVDPEPSPTPPETVHTMIEVTIPKTITAALDSRKPWYWFLRYESAGGVVRTAFMGKVAVIVAPPEPA